MSSFNQNILDKIFYLYYAIKYFHFFQIISESLLTLMTLKNVLVTSCCLQAFHGLFVSRPPKTVLSTQINGQIITALYDYQPPSSDTQPTLAWLTVMQEAHLNLAK